MTLLFHSSVAADKPGAGVIPPKAKADDFDPAPAKVFLAVARVVGFEVQDVPFQVSVAAEGDPPKATVAV
jgi:hypothetical protein